MWRAAGYAILVRMWRNWQTRTVQVRVSNIVKVRILSSAPEKAAVKAAKILWGVSAAGSASDWQSGGHEFEPRTLHHETLGNPRVFTFHRWLDVVR